MTDPDLLRLTAGQQALWYLDRLIPGTSAYSIGGAGRLEGELDVDALGHAVSALGARHPWIGVGIEQRGGEPVGVARSSARPRLEVIDGHALDRDAAVACAAAVVDRAYDLERGPLLRVALIRGGGRRSILVLGAHHVVADFAALAVLLGDLEALYRCRADSVSPALEPAAPLAAELAARETALLDSPRGARAWRFWQKTLAGDLPRLSLPSDAGEAGGRSATRLRGASVRRRLGADLGRQLALFAMDGGASTFAVLASAFQVLLHRFSGQRQVMLGTPATARERATRDVVCYLVNPLGVRADFTADPTFAEHLGAQRRAWLGAMRNRQLPYPVLVERLAAAAAAGSGSELAIRDAHAPLFQAMAVHYGARTPTERALLAFALGRGDSLEVGSWRLEPVALARSGAQLDLFLASAEIDGGIELELTYDRDRVDRAIASGMLAAFERLLAAAIAKPDTRVGRLPLLDGEARAALVAVGAPEPPAATAVSLDGRFFARAASDPDAEAIIDGARTWTYGDLAERASRIARRLAASGIGAEDLVAVAAPRRAEMIAGLLGVLAAGAAYVPMDPAYPAARLRMILDDCAARAVLVLGDPPSALASLSPPVIDLAVPEAEGGRAELPRSPAAGVDRLAYVIYTSGSTGRPKGVAISHRNADALVRWAADRFSDAERRGVLAATSICFDLSVFEIFATLGLGGRVVLAADALALKTLPAADRVTLVSTVPSAAAALAAEGAIGPSVTTACLAGEPLPGDLVARLLAASPALRVLNLYGPSEDTTYSSEAEIARGERAPPIGTAVSGSRVYVVDSELEPQPEGVVGEIVLGGGKVARGYWRRPALTAERFVPDPFGTEPGGRLYRTGDLGRWRRDGALAFFGRRDHQVKLRGFRIELGEIEVALRALDGVERAVVVARDETGQERLVAFVVGDRAMTAAAMRAALEARLPAYMVPQRIERLDDLPRLPNGKVDRARLRSMPLSAALADERTRFVAPSTEVEKTLAALWCEVLGVERVGIDDSFFALGGHSLLAMKVLARVREAFGVELPLRALLEQPTIAGVQRAIAGQLLSEADEETAAAVLAELGGDGPAAV